jgi:hypothetical protein
MFLYSRALTLGGSPRQVLPWVAQITEYVNANSSLAVAAWNADFGQPIGTVVWNSLVESQTSLADGAIALAGQDGYLDLVETAADMVLAPAQDTLARLVHGEPSELPGPGAVAMVTEATAVVDRIADTLAWSVEIAQHVESVTGTPVSVWSNVYGQMGRLAFISVSPDTASFDAGDAAVSADTGYFDRLAKSAGLWVEGSGHVARYTRIV